MRPHYLAREPGLGIPFVALIANVLLLLYVGAQLHASSGRLNLAMRQQTDFDKAQVVVSATGVTMLNGSPMGSLQELEFHLSALSANSNGISVEVPPNVPSQRLADVLQACSRAGFTDVALAIATEGKRQ